MRPQAVRRRGPRTTLRSSSRYRIRRTRFVYRIEDEPPDPYDGMVFIPIVDGDLRAGVAEVPGRFLVTSKEATQGSAARDGPNYGAVPSICLPLWFWSIWSDPSTIGCVEQALARFGQNVRAARKARGWTQEELAERSSLAPGQISRIERGKREIRLSSLLRLIGALGATADALLSEVPFPHPRASKESRPRPCEALAVAGLDSETSGRRYHAHARKEVRPVLVLRGVSRETP